MAIDTAVKRQSAFIDHRGVVLPDGSIDAGDRQTLLGQYRLLGAGVGGPADYCLYAELLQDAVQGLLLGDAAQAELMADALMAWLEC
jgi:hypothetical protein